MSRVIAIFNQKGGVGKTTTCTSLGSYLSYLGKKVLIVDLDPQYNATTGLGVLNLHGKTVYDALIGREEASRVIRKTQLANLDILPASPDLSGSLIELIDVEDREVQLKNVLGGLQSGYDFILIDLGPSVNLLTINGLMAADEVIIPVQCEYYSLEGLSQLLETINLIEEHLDHPLHVLGALLTMYDKRERLSREVAKEIRHRFPYKVFDIEIPRSVSLAEAPSFKKPIMFHAPQSPGAVAYERLAREILGEEPPEPEEKEESPVLHSMPEFRAPEKREEGPVRQREPERVPEPEPEPEEVREPEIEEDPGPLMIIIHDEEEEEMGNLDYPQDRQT